MADHAAPRCRSISPPSMRWSDASKRGLSGGGKKSTGLFLLLAWGNLSPVAGQEPVHLSAIPQARLTEVMALELIDAPMSGRPLALTESPGGSVFVRAGGEASVFVFEADGSFTGELGRRGRGPGEFQTLGSIGVHGDTLWAADLSLGRVTRFLPGGEVLETISPGGPEAVRHGIASGGMYVYRSSSGSLVGSRLGILGQADAGGRQVDFWWCWDPPTGTVDTLFSRRTRPTQLSVTVGGMTTTVMDPFGGPTGAVTFGGVEDYGLLAQEEVQGSSGAVVVQRIYCGGHRETSFTLAFTPERVTDADADALAEAAAAIIERRMSRLPEAPRPPRDVERRIRGSMNVPEYHKVVWGIRQGVRGAVWLTASPRVDYGTEDGVRWLVAREGHGAVGQLRLRFSQDPLYISPEYVWLFESDATQMTLGRIVKYRIEVP